MKRREMLRASVIAGAAAALGPALNVPVPPAYIEFHPSRYLRPFDAPMEDCDRGFPCGNPFLQFNQH